MTRIGIFTAVIALTLLSGCAGDMYRSGGFLGITFGRDAVWYDGYYGPYSGGYWARDHFFYPDGYGTYLQDSDGHFRRQRFEYAQKFTPSKPPHHDRGQK